MLDKASLNAFIRVSEGVATLNAYLIEHQGTVDADAFSPDFIDRLINGLSLVGVRDMGQLQAAITTHANMLNRFMLNTYGGSFKGIGFYAGASLVDLCYLLAIKRDGKPGLEEWFSQMKDEPRFTTVAECLACYNKAEQASNEAESRPWKG